MLLDPTRMSIRLCSVCVRALGSRPLLLRSVPGRSLSSDSGRDSKFRLTIDTINPRVKEMQYAVRGRIPLEAMSIEAQLKGGVKFPFDRVLFCNIGDCHAMGQRPLTFVRQLLAACLDPTTLHAGAYPSDVIERSNTILDSCKGNSLGAYSDSRGIPVIRKHIAEFISKRDEMPCAVDSVYLSNGASDGIKRMLYLCLSKNQALRTGVMIPIPQYPLYTASIAEMNAFPIHYHLKESDQWSIDVENLKQAISDSRVHCEPRILVVINPGNPTGQYLPVDNMRAILRFCRQEGLILFTDEVYQENVYDETASFQSFRQVQIDMGQEYADLQMACFNSTSKGFFGECGIRGGYMHLVGLDVPVMEQLYKLCSINLCPNTAGQVVTDALVKQPQPGDPSYQLYNEERETVLETLAWKADMVHRRINSIPGVSCNSVQGAMYAFPKIEIPAAALEDARKEDPSMELDAYYCLQFLREKGVCVVPGSGFGQEKGTYHFRTTILPPRRDLEDMLDRFADFHVKFHAKYGSKL